MPVPRSSQPWRLSPRMVSLLIMLLVTAATLGVRHLGHLQFLEFQAYDYLIRDQPRAESSEPMVLVELTEDDIHHPTLDWPIPDRELAALLRRILADEPALIGLDIWRDLPVPKNGAHYQELADVLQAHPQIIGIYTLDGIAKPPALRDRPQQTAFNDNLPPDVEIDETIPKVRRTILFQNTASGEHQDSLPFRLAVGYLELQGIYPEPDPHDPKAIILGKSRLRAFQPNDGAYVGAKAGGWQMLIDFKCPDRFIRYSVTSVLNDQIPTGLFRDKIVMVGVNTESVLDDRVTPTRRNHRGIELQSLIVNQLLRQAINGDIPRRYWSELMEDLWTALWCLAAVVLAHNIRSPWIASFLALCCIVGLVGTYWMAFQYGWWIPLVAPAVAFVPAGAMVTSYISFEEWRSREQLMQLFSRQVSPDIAQELWAQRDLFLSGHRPRSLKLTATVVFTDLDSFSTTSESMDPADLMDWLNQYMEAMASPIMAHHGVIEKYIGDAIMAVFGVPIARTTHEEISQDARNAVRCALAMATTMQQLNDRWRSTGRPQTGMRIGIHTGTLVAGSLGSTERQEYTVIGDSVNTASRLESYDKSWTHPDSPHPYCRILISEATLSHLGEEFQVTRVGTILLKNKHEPVTVYSVIAPPPPNHRPIP